MQPRRPVPINLKVRDLDHSDRVTLECPVCHKVIGRQGYDLSLELPAETLVIDYVTKRVCRTCSRPGRPVRALGFIEPRHRSGACNDRSAVTAPERPSRA
jgi:hypothetical protein